MKTLCAVLALAAFSSQAALVHFQLSPPGTDVAVGLSPSNQVPVVTNSTGSGGTISGGIVFDTDSNLLQVAIGYGSAAGFANLGGAATAMSIDGPAPAGQNAGPVFDLSPFNFPAANATNGGAIVGAISVSSNDVAALLGGSNYVTIATALNPNGEIRGQLVPVVISNQPPSVTCPGATNVECGTPTELAAMVSDPDGDALAVVWMVNGMPVQTNAVPASSPPGTAGVSFSELLPLGTNVVTVTATDTATNSASCSTVVTVVDTIPPVIVSASANPNTLWPPNHKLVKVTVHAVVTDACGPTTWKIISVSSNETDEKKGNGNGNGKGNGKGNNGKGNNGNGNGGNGNGNGNGGADVDWIITGDHTVKLRAERSGQDKQGRIYTITIQATDEAGNLSTPVDVMVVVPHDRGNH
jgi:hypothetical protein